MTVKPYQDRSTSKKEQVRSMFNSIAHSYDFLNHFLSLNTDRGWRRKLRGLVKKTWSREEMRNKHFLDLATGTGDLAFTLEKLEPASITGLDFSERMLEIGKSKARKKESKVSFHLGDAEDLPFPDEEFDLVTVAFGVRNYQDLEKGLSEIYRVLRKGGWFYILEFSRPGKGVVPGIYRFYSRRILPGIAAPFSGNRQAYVYLPDSVEAFPSGEEFLGLPALSGFANRECHPLTAGIATIYRGCKI